jgi:hypothetical protein
MIGSNAPTIFDVLQTHPPKSSFPSANGECRGWGMEAGLQHMELSLLRLRVPRVDLSHLLRSPNNTVALR